MKKTGPKTVKRTVVIVLCAALFLSGGTLTQISWEKEKEERRAYWENYYAERGYDPSWTYDREILDSMLLKADVRQDLLDISYVAGAGSSETGWALPPDMRMDMHPMGLGTFYPTYSYMFRTEDTDQTGSYIDIHVREKDGPIGESFFPYSVYGGHYDSARDYLKDHDDVVTTESYHDAADFFEKNYGEALAGENRSYQSFTMLDEVTVDGVPAYHYEYTWAFNPLRELTGWLQNNFGKEKHNCAYETYSEQYLFETDRYIYLFAYSGRERNEEHSAYLRRMVESIEIDNERKIFLPLSEDFFSSNCQKYLDN